MILLAVSPAAVLGISLAEALDGATAGIRRVSGSLGIHVVDLGSRETIFETGSDRDFIVASNTKLATTAAALELLGPGHFFETPLLRRGALRNGILEGDLAIIGGGDPNLSGRHYDGDSLAIFRGWGEALARLGVRRIRGDLYLVHGLFQPPEVHPEWPRDQLSKWYEAPVSALSFSDNCVLVRVTPASRSGRPPRVEVIPDLPVVQVRNLAKTIGTVRGHRVSIDRQSGTDLVTVSGSVYRKAAPVDSWVTVPDPVGYFGSALLEGLRQGGVTIDGEQKPLAALPRSPEWKVAHVHRSDLLTTLEVTNKRSQNFYAESLLKALGALRCRGGSWSSGLEAVREFLDGVGFDRTTYTLADGSGMSRSNRLSPLQVTGLLEHMFFHPHGSQFVQSLPHSGEEGLSWESRLAEPGYRGNVFAKTGSLRGVSTLSGFAKAKSGRIYAFSILCNGTASNWDAKKAQDEFLRRLIDLG